MDEVVFDVEIEIKEDFLKSLDIDLILRCDSLDKDCYSLGTEDDISSILNLKYSGVEKKVVKLN